MRDPLEPSILPAKDIPDSSLDQDALRVVSRLTRQGFEAYLVGGCVRDLLLGRVPKDFDVATSAHPRQVKRLFACLLREVPPVYAVLDPCDRLAD